MAQTTICIRIDADLKKNFETFCDSIGMSMSTAVNIFIKKSVGEQRIPFEITAKNNVNK
ncbi:MAG: type II toxin-antitoxin system RelB/DinJ family antitoxin [Megasphaera sp.]|uniref:type II toxin-antitoxin system RelB/DinJ family antitoxin n=1 Tax=Megasphaera sp. TaxID=2023260 RepID=UPI003F0AEDAE